MPDNTDGDRFSLIEMLRQLRSDVEASQAMLADDGKLPLFYLNQVEVEVNFVVEKGISGHGGLNIHFFALGSQADYKAQNVHKLKLVLSTSPATGGAAVAGAQHGSREPR